MIWDGLSSRAVLPGPQLSSCVSPTLGSRSHAVDSPYPCGIGVYTLSDNGTPTALPLYYVPPSAAEDPRRRGVKPGWYVCAEPGKLFELHITVVHETLLNVNGRQLEDSEGVRGSLLIDDNQEPVYKFVVDKRLRPRSQWIVRGFPEMSLSEEGRPYMLRTVRRFEFQKKNIIPDCNQILDSDASSIQLKMFVGPLLRIPIDLMRRDSWQRNASGDEQHEPVGEKEAVKFGRSLKVERSPQLHVYAARRRDCKSIIIRPPILSEVVINLYLRERFWLQSRNIIGDDGNVWLSKPLSDKEGSNANGIGEVNHVSGIIDQLLGIEEAMKLQNTAAVSKGDAVPNTRETLHASQKTENIAAQISNTLQRSSVDLTGKVSSGVKRRRVECKKVVKDFIDLTED